MKKISVIVPVYNSEAYLEQCVRSLIGQTYQNWEALLIDDGSTDHSLEVCESLRRTDGRIKVCHQENRGVSAARNHGLERAEGEYVYFLDSDDAIHPLLFEEMMWQVEEHHVEMAFCNHARVDDRQMDAALAGCFHRMNARGCRSGTARNRSGGFISTMRRCCAGSAG